MYHISANLAFGRRGKNIWGYKKLQGGKKPIRKTEKKVATFFFCFLKTVKFLWGAAKNEQGAPNGNVTPLVIPIRGYLIINYIHVLLNHYDEIHNTHTI